MNDARRRSDRGRDGRTHWLSMAAGMVGLLFFLLALYSALELLRATEAAALSRRRASPPARG